MALDTFLQPRWWQLKLHLPNLQRWPRESFSRLSWTGSARPASLKPHHWSHRNQRRWRPWRCSYRWSCTVAHKVVHNCRWCLPAKEIPEPLQKSLMLWGHCTTPHFHPNHGELFLKANSRRLKNEYFIGHVFGEDNARNTMKWTNTFPSLSIWMLRYTCMQCPLDVFVAFFTTYCCAASWTGRSFTDTCQGPFLEEKILKIFKGRLSRQVPVPFLDWAISKAECASQQTSGRANANTHTHTLTLGYTL